MVAVSGKRTVASRPSVLPCTTRLSSVICPPRAFAISRQIVKPSPEPPPWPAENGWNSLTRNSAWMPGPQSATSADLVWALIASLYIGNVILLILNLPMVGLWVKLLKIPKPYLYAGILIFATVGVYGMRQSAFDLVLLYASA